MLASVYTAPPHKTKGVSGLLLPINNNKFFSYWVKGHCETVRLLVAVGD